MQSAFTLIIGLGNPGKEYDGTRHNVGRIVASRFASTAGAGEFRFEKKWNAEVSEGKVGSPGQTSKKIIILLPNTLMNKSGTAAGLTAQFYKIKPAHIFVIHDDADIPLGRAKLSFGKRSAGHKGVESLIKNLKTTEFWRFRIGIAGKRGIPAEKIVLKRFTPEEKRLIARVTKRTLEALETAITESPEFAMNSYNQ